MTAYLTSWNGKTYFALASDFPDMTAREFYIGSKIYFRDTGVVYLVDNLGVLRIDPNTPINASGGGGTSDGLTNTQLRATPVPTSDIVIGALADAAVVTDASGSISAKLRGMIKLLVDKITVKLDTGTNLIGKVSIDQVTANANEVVLKSGTVTSKGTGFSIPVTLTVTNGAYSIGDVVGGLITFANASSAAGKRSIIHSITLAGVAALAYELWFFASDITTPAADNAALALVAADIAQCKGVIPIPVTAYNAAQTAFNIATLTGCAFEFSCAATTLCAYLKTTVATPPGTTTLTLTINGEYID